MDLKKAKGIAIDVCKRLQPYCIDGKINIAGSIRRKNPEVKDIEIICLPKIETATHTLFGDIKEYRSAKFMEIVTFELGEVKKGKATGKMMQIELEEKIMLDLFIPDPFDYFRQYAIRTGSASYSQVVIATGWNKIGWVGSDKGLRKEEDCKAFYTTVNGVEKRSWKCINKDAELPPVWQSEQEFFEWIKVPWISPELRKSFINQSS